MQRKHFLLVALVMCFVRDAQALNVGTGVVTDIYGVQVGLTRNDQVEFKVIAAIAGLILATKVAYDVSWHSTYDTRISEHYQGLKKQIYDNNVKNVNDAALLNFSSQGLREDVLYLETSISNSYDSWLCPWNWTPSQKTAHQHIAIVSIFTLYADLLRAGNQLSDQDILQYCRNMFVFTTMYPYVACHSKIQSHLAFIKSFADSQEDEIVCSMLQDMATQLEKFKRRLQGQKEYVDELQIMRTHALQQQANAQRASRRY
ncbi:MAG: hypothetical protein NTZ68_02195 [Candidatus Dependentiae bacterium]|nr:hypothetical protein [Candidatus Dependentiae bacterium]